jgi:hypothetical protein
MNTETMILFILDYFEKHGTYPQISVSSISYDHTRVYYDNGLTVGVRSIERCGKHHVLTVLRDKATLLRRVYKSKKTYIYIPLLYID